MALEEELEEERTKYEALQQTWMAANENFLRFQVFLEIKILKPFYHINNLLFRKLQIVILN